MPPVALTVALYGMVSIPLCSAVVVIASGGLMTSVNVLLEVSGGVELSVTVMVTLLVPAVVGVPLIWPDAALMRTLSGSPTAEKVRGAFPPATLMGARYATPTVPPG